MTAQRPERRELAAIHAALDFLCETQVDEVEARRSDGTILAGEWPQWLSIRTSLGPWTLRDANAFTTACVHLALTSISERNAVALALSPDQIYRARAARVAAVRLVARFRCPEDSPATGAYGYWLVPPPRGASVRAISKLVSSICSGEPQFHGTLAPIRPRILPPDYYIWPDADTTAMVYRTILAHRQVDGAGFKFGTPDLEIFGRWRDQIDINRYAPAPPVLPSGSGAFLTWFHSPSHPDSPNEVDLVVNANVLTTLGLYNRLDVQGVEAAVAWIVDAIQAGHHRELSEVTPQYQHAWLLHAAVANAFASGVDELEPAVEILCHEVLSEARCDADGSVFWDGQNRILATAASASTLLDCGYSGPLLDGAVAFLVREQSGDGSWKTGWIDLGSTDSGMDWDVKSTAALTALSMQVLCRYSLANCEPKYG